MSVSLKKDYSKQTEAVVVDSEERIVDLLEENINIARQNFLLLKKINHWILFQKIKGWLYLVLIVLPVVVAIFYLPPLLDKWIGQYQKTWQMIVGLRDKDNQGNYFPTTTVNKAQIKEFCRQFNQK